LPFTSVSVHRWLDVQEEGFIFIEGRYFGGSVQTYDLLDVVSSPSFLGFLSHSILILAPHSVLSATPYCYSHSFFVLSALAQCKRHVVLRQTNRLAVHAYLPSKRLNPSMLCNKSVTGVTLAIRTPHSQKYIYVSRKMALTEDIDVHQQLLPNKTMNNKAVQQ
jgi:hypothetical protein